MTLGDEDETARAAAAAMWADDRAAQAEGVEIVEVGPGRAVVAMTVVETMVNSHGLCHGGHIFLLADTAFAYACNSRGARHVAQYAQVTFLAPARLGDRLIAAAIERHRAERSGLTDVTVSDGAGRAIAEFRGHSRAIAGSLTAKRSV